MKKSHLAFIIIGLVLTTIVIWVTGAASAIKPADYLQILIILVLLAFGVFFGIRRIKSKKKGEPIEDELSKRIMHKASSVSYFVSLYLWLVIMYITDKGEYETGIMFGWGILGMGLIFAVSWTIIYLRGLKGD